MKNKEWDTDVFAGGVPRPDRGPTRKYVRKKSLKLECPDNMAGTLRRVCHDRRAELKWSTNKIESICGVDHTHIADWERGTVDMCTGRISEVLDALGLEVVVRVKGAVDCA